MRFWIACFALILACTGCHTGIRSWLAGHKAPYLGKTDPSYELSTVDGRRTSLAAYRGKVIVVAMWATWCPPCRAEVPELDRYAAEATRRGITVVGLNTGEPATSVARFVQAMDVHYPVLLDPSQQYWHYYDITAIPQTIVLNRAGVPVKVIAGEFDRDAVDDAVKQGLRWPGRPH